MRETDWKEGLPYRPNVGICLINRDGLIWMGKGGSAGPEIVCPGKEWQMPQGGIDNDTDITEAARRELWEETGSRSADLIGQTQAWWTYDFPIPSPDPKYKLAPFRGQKQKWVAFRFTGTDDEFDITADHVDEAQEFFEWRWVKPEDAFEICVDYKLETYKKVFSYWSQYLFPLS